MLAPLLYKLDYPKPKGDDTPWPFGVRQPSQPRWRGSLQAGLYRISPFYATERRYGEEPSRFDARNPFIGRLHQGKTTDARVRDRAARAGVFQVPYKPMLRMGRPGVESRISSTEAYIGDELYPHTCDDEYCHHRGVRVVIKGANPRLDVLLHTYPHSQWEYQGARIVHVDVPHSHVYNGMAKTRQQFLSVDGIKARWYMVAGQTIVVVDAYLHLDSGETSRNLSDERMSHNNWMESHPEDLQTVLERDPEQEWDHYVTKDAFWDPEHTQARVRRLDFKRLLAARVITACIMEILPTHIEAGDRMWAGTWHGALIDMVGAQLGGVERSRSRGRGRRQIGLPRHLFVDWEFDESPFALPERYLHEMSFQRPIHLYLNPLHKRIVQTRRVNPRNVRQGESLYRRVLWNDYTRTQDQDDEEWDHFQRANEYARTQLNHARLVQMMTEQQLWEMTLVISRLMANFTNPPEASGVVSDCDGGWEKGPGASVEPIMHKICPLTFVSGHLAVFRTEPPARPNGRIFAPQGTERVNGEVPGRDGPWFHRCFTSGPLRLLILFWGSAPQNPLQIGQLKDPTSMQF